MIFVDKIKQTTAIKQVFVVKYTFFCFLIFFLGFMFLKYPLNTAEGIKRGMELCVDTLVPTLFPFLVISELIINTGVFNRVSIFMGGLTKMIFAQPSQAFTVYLLSITGGYPIGPSIIKKLYENKEIDMQQAQRMLLYSFAPGPAFVISTVGYGMLGSQKNGIVIYLSIVAASFVMGILSGFLSKEKELYSELISPPKIKTNFSRAFVESIDNSSKSMISVCAWVIFFCCIMKLADIVIKNPDIKNIILCLSEVTTACRFLSTESTLEMLAAIISFGGFAVHFQVMSCVIKIRMKMKHFFASRVVHAVLSCIICHFIMTVMPESVDVVSVGARPTTVNQGGTISLSFVLFVMSCLIMLGDNLVVRLNRRNI